MHSKYHDTNAVTIPLSYPPIQPESSDLKYAHAMLSNVGSDNSEMGAVSLYFYNSIILCPEFISFARCFHEISIVEMHHLNIFASFARQMGLDPRLWSVNGKTTYYWTPAYNHYPYIVQEVIQNSIKMEMAAIKKYTLQAQTIQDANIVENLNRIIIDEKHHIEIFKTMLMQVT